MQSREEQPTVIQYVRNGKLSHTKTPDYIQACKFLILNDLRTTNVDHIAEVGIWVFDCCIPGD